MRDAARNLASTLKEEKQIYDNNANAQVYNGQGSYFFNLNRKNTNANADANENENDPTSPSRRSISVSLGLLGENNVRLLGENNVGKDWSMMSLFLEKVYKKYSPKKVAEIPSVLEKWTGHEETLVRMLCEKYKFDADSYDKFVTWKKGKDKDKVRNSKKEEKDKEDKDEDKGYLHGLKSAARRLSLVSLGASLGLGKGIETVIEEDIDGNPTADDPDWPHGTLPLKSVEHWNRLKQVSPILNILKIS